VSNNVPNNVVVQEETANNVNVYQDAPNSVIINEDTAAKVVVNQDAPNQVVVKLATSTGVTRRLVYTQASPSALWTINHSLGGRPSITVVDTAGTVVIGEVTYISNSQITVTFTAAFAGYAYLT
jgi:hypothetical protein